ncbi:MAG: nucleotide exchange factor GrpE [Candidatus Krumholzibacteria bacterium]|nr:nucleotide exchange factor GrpE [Candidatus Krumholzibacteria bacterium]
MTGKETGKNERNGEETAVERPGSDEQTRGSAGGPGDGGDAAGGEHPHDGMAKPGRKRSKRHKDKELAELLSRKNEMLQDLGNRLAESEQLAKKHEDRLLRLAAEFENYKKRTRREWELHEKRAAAGLVKSLLHVLDDFDRALQAPADAGDQFRAGTRLISSSLTETLAREGLGEIDAMGKPFDPQVHEAGGEVRTGDIEPGCVAEVVQRGYTFHDQVLRPARVLVSKGKDAEGGSE